MLFKTRRPTVRRMMSKSRNQSTKHQSGKEMLDEVMPLLWERKRMMLVSEEVEKGRWGTRIEEEETCVGRRGQVPDQTCRARMKYLVTSATVWMLQPRTPSSLDDWAMPD
jgi:hypothetical protein